MPVVVTGAVGNGGVATGYVLAVEGLRLEVPRRFDREETRVRKSVVTCGLPAAKKIGRVFQ